MAGAVVGWGFGAFAGDSPDNKADWWGFRAATNPAVPIVARADLARNEIDRFILAKLEEKHLVFSPETDRHALLRRVTFDLIGLPPTPEEMEAFVSDTAPDAYEKVVKRLLASPRHGERWARHWLDTVHYGESHGYEKDKPRLNAWPYRDYVIRALNQDKPYFRFIEEQIAGDVLYPEEADGIFALGFLAAGPWDYVGHVELPLTKTDGLIARYQDRDDMVMNTMSTLQSLTVHCARCHDHKFDPISQREYYSLQAVFAGVDRAERPVDENRPVAQTRRRLNSELRRLASARQALEAEMGQVSARAGAVPSRPATSDQREVPSSLRLRSDVLDAEMVLLKNQLATLPKPQMVYAAATEFAANGSFVPAREPRPVHLLKRGDVTRPVELIPPGAVAAVPGVSARFELEATSDEAPRRAALAKWITDTNNLLTRRSIVNRVWHYHFGRGLVETPNDFGHMGALPSHPELLDWLAFWFMEHGESIKDLHRLIVTSATYRQGSGEAVEGARVDAGNRLLWRMNRSRLEAEQIHDALLAISGRLDLKMGGTSVRQFSFKDDHSPIYDYGGYAPDGPGAARRSIYRFVVRSVPDPFMEIMDCPDASILTPVRSVTMTALQALALLNNPLVLRQCEYLAARLARERDNLEGQMTRAYELILQRTPEKLELEKLQGHARKHGLASACRILFNCNEFMFVD